MTPAQIAWLPDGKRLHLQHGPIDMILEVEGPGRAAALRRAAARFQTLLEELVRELPRLKQANGAYPEGNGAYPEGETARLMTDAAALISSEFVTPMAAVAGAGADTILRSILSGKGIDKAYVNNGGDVACWVSEGSELRASVGLMQQESILIKAEDRIGGVATSGWRGRSMSLGIADSVTILSRTAAMADAAATLVANAVNLPNHPAIKRCHACDVVHDSDLGERLVTRDVGRLKTSEIDAALDAGVSQARLYLESNFIQGALLQLQGEYRIVGTFPRLVKKDLAYA